MPGKSSKKKSTGRKSSYKNATSAGKKPRRTGSNKKARIANGDG